MDRSEYIAMQKDKARKMTQLLDNELFQELIINDFIKSGIVEQALNQNIDSTATQDELKARQTLHKYIFNAIIVSE